MHMPFPIIFFDFQTRSESPSNVSVQPLIDALEKSGADVQVIIKGTSTSSFFKGCTRAAAIVLLLENKHIRPEDDSLKAVIQGIRKSHCHAPIFLKSELQVSHHIPKEILNEVHGFIHNLEDTLTFTARNIIREAKKYLDQLAPPFFKALATYTKASSASWHCPGHSGGAAYLKSPSGQLFHDFFGENMLRADVCNAVDELGQLLDHTGPIAESERQAAKIYQSDHLYFVTNGTSSSNKIVWHSLIAPDDIVVVDRNSHKSIIQAIIMTGAIPIFLTPTRNHLGIIGPIPKHEFAWDSIQEKIRNHPLIKDKEKKPRLFSITQSTYDGILYNTNEIKSSLDGHFDAIHFDEAWAAHTGFHECYEDFVAISETQRCEKSLLFSTQSTHKMLAGLSQASQILVQDAKQQKLDHHCFNEAYLMHTSTSPHYPIIASCDITAAMMAQPNGQLFIGEAIAEAIDFRSTMQQIAENHKDNWWFKVWEPREASNIEKPNGNHWKLKQTDGWHGFEDIQSGFNLLDPLKITIITPGLELNGEFCERGMPASIATKYLAEHGVIVEKVSLYSFLLLFTIGVTKSRWNTLITVLQRLKKAYDDNIALTKVMPQFAEQNPQYKTLGLKDMCQKIHDEYRQHDYARMTTQIFNEPVQTAIKPTDAYNQLIRKNTERVPVDQLEGRITTMLITPYPPGIPVLIPGERFNKTIVDYLKFAQHFNGCLPGLETHIHGLIEAKKNGEYEYYVECVKE
ncbi:ornithine decarboxylase [Marinomonas alcarazii]|uniref:Ornithine decarboxylase n=1 Tax=Marinomonas alcarazii TaxID=491949 RepID=A0A318VDW6_9GAMM|nr:arginine/lysine/ornithine decarboxylase [Marinomonas alcarazii]PYF84565.1 ornithine decarboxylase [Marinomonas alcarazii]